MKEVKKILAKQLEDVLEADVETSDLEIPDDEHGDFAYPCMKAAAELGENPRQLAEQAAEELEGHQLIESVDVAGPGYLNFNLKKDLYAEKIVEELQKDRLGAEKQSGKVLLEFSSPNVAKPMHIGHFRNNVLGDSLQRILNFVGYDITSENYLGDWGTQYGKLIYAFKEHGSIEEFEENPMEHMYDLYVKFHEEAEDDEGLEDKGREWSKKVEEGDEEAQRLWSMFREASIEYHLKDYQRMDIEFDRITGESKVVDRAREIIEEGLEKDILKEDNDGSIYAEFEELPNTVLRRADGSTLYLPRDVANVKKRENEGFNQNLYVVASEQDLHFKQLFKLAKRYGITDIENEHISYGLIHLEEGSMSSRSGNIIRISEILDEAVEKAEERIEDRSIDAAEPVGIGAIKYANLAVSRNKDIEFSWDRALSFEGDSGPYLQYSNTRAKSIVAETDDEGKLVEGIEDMEHRLLKKLGKFPEVVDNAAESREPAKIANYLSELCEEFNSFYHDCPVLDADEQDRNRRLKIVETFIEVTDTGLNLLGIEPLDRM